MITLKLAFAMGGGVSLGAFSGSALTEAMKLALLRIVDGKADYDRVEIDVFSGASAGCLSLAIMLRALTWRTKAEILTAEKNLNDLYPNLNLNELDEWLRKDLIVAQIAQDLQERAWVENIDLDQLLGSGRKSRLEALQYAPSLLDSDAVYDIARRLLIPSSEDGIQWERRLLSDRCLFACTLTSLTPFITDASQTFSTTKDSLPGLRDALRSQVHKDMRVFDLLFEKKLTDEDARRSEKNQSGYLSKNKKIAEASEGIIETFPKTGTLNKNQKEVLNFPAPRAPEYPPRWYRLHHGASIEGVASNYREPESWAILAATALASGAFPCAFAPAVLNRFSWEYGWLPDGDTETNLLSTWPACLKERGASEHPFAYIDGGVFNNEPVREAYRLLSFMDSRDEQKYKRIILFVDPSVGPENSTFGVSTLVETKHEKKSWFNFNSISAGEQRNSLSRLSSTMGGLVNLLIHQGRSRDADDLLATRDGYKIREIFRNSMRGILEKVDNKLADELWVELTTCCAVLINARAQELIPMGDGSVIGEYKRIMKELHLDHLRGSVEDYDQRGFEHQEIRVNQAQWLWIHTALYFDLALGLGAKHEASKLIAITPYKKSTSDISNIQPLKLLGAPVNAFAGFMSKQARVHDFEAGRYCAGLFFEKEYADSSTTGSMINPDYLQKMPVKEGNMRQIYEEELNEGFVKLYQRVCDVVKSGTNPTIASFFIRLFDMKSRLKEQISEIVEDRFTDNDRNSNHELNRTIEFVVLVPETVKLFLDAKGLPPFNRDSSTRMMHFAGKWRPVLATSLEFTSRRTDNSGNLDSFWKGSAVHENQCMVIDKDGFLGLGQHWAVLGLPSENEWKHLSQVAHTHLRPIVYMDLSKNPSPDGDFIPSSKWIIGEAAIPLAKYLINT